MTDAARAFHQIVGRRHTPDEKRYLNFAEAYAAGQTAGLLKRLRLYLRHVDDCTIQSNTSRPMFPCSCGLASLLATTEG